MRGWLVISVLALAGCGEHQGWNPNYQYGANAYGEYRVAREKALVTNTESPATIPVALPAEAFTPEQIAGASPVPVPTTMGAGRFRRATTATVATTSTVRANPNAPSQIVPDSMLPKTTTGPYPGSTPVLVRYAFAQEHAPGTRVFARTAGSATQATRACASYQSADAAQTAFLAAGGPDRDPRGMDPDGDGFVCGWNPAPFRQPQL
ncbi:hypothetical protein H4P12_00225 [Paracoccus sp. 11-3]|uniref:Excalibur calcium-binding domain-containing protein n=1 Tax=Paracoccus amoyensis TaxID=2760093 RepID=A0A926J9M7_9RHOB|nr:hypothetical protein [Paracoccus amoyensis]MBC9245171.1 hypothetical protein [Paracoccus amoyensis]